MLLLGNLAFRLRSVFPSQFRSFALKSPVTPDFNTSVDIHTHTLRTRRAEKLKMLETETAGSLIPASLKHTEQDEEHKETARQLLEMGQEKLTIEERKKRRRALHTLGVPNFHEFLAERSIVLAKKSINILQVRIFT